MGRRERQRRRDRPVTQASRSTGSELRRQRTPMEARGRCGLQKWEEPRGCGGSLRERPWTWEWGLRATEFPEPLPAPPEGPACQQRDMLVRNPLPSPIPSTQTGGRGPLWPEAHTAVGIVPLAPPRPAPPPRHLPQEVWLGHWWWVGMPRGSGCGGPELLIADSGLVSPRAAATQQRRYRK